MTERKSSEKALKSPLRLSNEDQHSDGFIAVYEIVQKAGDQALRPERADGASSLARTQRAQGVSEAE